MPSAISRTSRCGELAPFTSTRCASDCPLKSSITRKTAPLVVDAVVDGGHRTGVPDLVRDVPLAEKARAHGLVALKLGVKDLHRDGLQVVLVGRRVDRRHAADAEQLVEPPLAAERLTDAPLGRLDVVVRRRLIRGRVYSLLGRSVARLRPRPSVEARPSLGDRPRCAGTRRAVRMRMRFTSDGVSDGFASSICATTLDTMGAEKLVPSTIL